MMKRLIAAVRRDVSFLFGFFKEDNGNLSSMRLALVWCIIVLVPLFLILCAFYAPVREMAGTFFTFVFGICGLKAAQKTAETDVPPPKP